MTLLLRDTHYPPHIIDFLYNVLKEEQDFVGEKPLPRGFIIKRHKDRATISYDDGKHIYAVKTAKLKNDWRVIGVASMWIDIQELLKIE